MLQHQLYRALRTYGLSLATVLAINASAQAEQFIGFGQPGLPGRWAVETFPVYNRNADGNVRAGGNTVLAYFSETGFTETTRDQLQFWVGAVPGYASTNGAKNTNAWGVASPNLGFAYYYNVVEPMGVDEFQKDPALTRRRIIEQAFLAVEEDGAEAIILGCTIEFGFFEQVQREVGVPVIDPVVAAFKMAEALAGMKRRFGWSPSRVGSCEPPPEAQINAFGLFQGPVPIGNRIDA